MTMLTELEGTGEKFSLDSSFDMPARTAGGALRPPTRCNPACRRTRRRPSPTTSSKAWRCAAAGTTSSCAVGPTRRRTSWRSRSPAWSWATTTSSSSTSGRSTATPRGTQATRSSSGRIPITSGAKKEVRQIWDRVREEWFTNGSTGRELYDYATSVAAEYGWKLNMDLSGHRLSDFPHSRPLRRPPGGGRVPSEPKLVGARDRHRPPRAEVRRLL